MVPSLLPMQVGEASALAQNAASKYQLDHVTEQTIEDLIRQFEKEL